MRNARKLSACRSVFRTFVLVLPINKFIVHRKIGWARSFLYTARGRSKTVPQNVPQRDANQAAHARYAVHARIFLLGGFVSVENKECCIYLPKLVIRVRFPSPAPFLRGNFLTPNPNPPTVGNPPPKQPPGAGSWVRGRRHPLAVNANPPPLPATPHGRTFVVLVYERGPLFLFLPPPPPLPPPSINFWQETVKVKETVRRQLAGRVPGSTGCEPNDMYCIMKVARSAAAKDHDH